MTEVLPKSMDVTEYKHVVLRLISCKYISYSFEEQLARMEVRELKGIDSEGPGEDHARGIF